MIDMQSRNAEEQPLEILVACAAGCRVFSEAGELPLELAGKDVGPIIASADGSSIALVAQKELWRRDADRRWSPIASANFALQSILEHQGTLLGGGLEEAAMVRLSAHHEPERLRGFDQTPGRSEWFANGPPLGVRSLASTCDGETLLAAVHVGGLPRSDNRGATWAPTLPVAFDVHEVRTHPVLPRFAAAAAAVGLCVSHDAGRHWTVLATGLEITNALAVAVLDSEVLFSIQEGPFAARSQLWRWPIEGGKLEQVRQGLPDWLEGKVDTGQIATGQGRAALCDGGGNLWLSTTQSSGWRRLATGLGYAAGLLVL